MAKQQHYEQLVRRYLDNSATTEELAIFFQLLEKGELDVYLEELSFSEAEPRRPVSVLRSARKVVFSYRMLGYVAAATLAWAIFSGITFVNNAKKKPASATAAAAVPQALPGSKKAVLTLADGRALALGNNEQRLQEAGLSLKADANGLVYEKSSDAPVAPAFNTIATPLGGEYRLTLPDGTTVWLNAGSSLRYPTTFAGAERRVELSGEAFFSVTKNAAQPFVVHTSNADVKVLGTQFNVMAYADEAHLRTTLDEGAVVVKTEAVQERLAPGEAATVAKGETAIAVAPADLALDLAWKNGNFDFQKTQLSTIMKQIARWYNLEIRYAGAVPDKRFVGRISRNTNLSEVLAILQLTGLRFRMNGRILTVEN